MNNAVFQQYISFLVPYLKRTDIVEICINQEGEVWLETMTGEWEHKKEKKITKEAVRLLTKNMATKSGQTFDPSTPYYSGRIPVYDYRIQVNMFSHVESGVSVSIRLGKADIRPIDSYMSKKEAEKLISFVKEGKTILICADTGAGKTTFLNSLSTHIPMNQRIVTIEDTRELLIQQPNKVPFIKSKSDTDVAGLKYKDFINFCTRIRPDRILMGEIDTDNTMLFLNLSNSGHGGSISTMHSDTESRVFNKICLNAQMSGINGVSSEALMQFAKEAIDVLVFLKKEIINKKRVFSARFVEVKNVK